MNYFICLLLQYYWPVEIDEYILIPKAATGIYATPTRYLCFEFEPLAVIIPMVK